MNGNRVTLNDVAARAGVHRTTVARALQGHPGIPAETRDRLKALALEMGFSPDPMLGALTAYRLKKRPPAFHGQLAWIDMWPERGMGAKIFDCWWAGASRRAGEVGYRLEDFWAREAGMTADRLSRILRAQGITGVLIAPLPAPGETIPLHWDWFSAVAISPSIITPRVHLVHNAQYETMRELIQRAHSLGYRKPGLVLETEMDGRVRQAWSAGFHSGTRRLGISWVESFFELTEVAPFPEAAFLQWLKRFRPDVLISHSIDFRPYLRKAGYRIPAQIGCLWTNPRLIGPEASGSCQQEEEIGAAAVDLLTACIMRNERGIPATQLRVLVSSRWVPGKTVRKQ